MMVLKPDAFARVRLFSPEAGGRSSVPPATHYRCPVYFGEQRQDVEEVWECAFLLDQADGTLQPGGESAIVPIKFMNPVSIQNELHSGASFVLWEGRNIGVGEIVETPNDRDG
jgi:hypothetical protein